MRHAAILIALVAAACASQPEPTGYRDASGTARQPAALHADAAECEYDIRKSRAGMPWVPPEMFRSCMAARGWRAVY